MAKATYTKTTKRQKKVPEGTMRCNVCKGKGYYKKPSRKK